MDLKFYFVIGLLIIIIAITLAIEIYFSDYFNNKDSNIEDDQEGFQTLSKTDLANMQSCYLGTAGCRSINYYDSSGTLKQGNFLQSSLPPNMYLDSSNILQSVPYGNKVNADYKSYSPYVVTTKNKMYADIAKLKENSINNPIPCDKTQRSLYYPNTKTVCTDISYLTIDGDNPVINYGEIIIPDNYYIDTSSGLIKLIPFGYTVTPDKRTIIINSDFSKQISSTSFNSDNYDVQYHTDASEISSYADSGTAGAGKMWILDKSGNLVSVPYSEISGNTLYNEPGSFRFGSSNYVPNYEESVYLSKLTNISTVTPVNNSSVVAAGFCSTLYPDKNALEQECNALDKNSCASTSCCALLGGQKCVYGNESGPYFKSNYSNFMVTNPEFYYYQGKCYGNCGA